LRIALLTHSANPRGAVVHAVELADALTELGHEAVLQVPDPDGSGLFRPTRCRIVKVPARPVAGGLRELVQTRIEDYVAYFSRDDAERYDIYHAHDGIGGNALATLVSGGAIPRYVQTVHHLDDYADEQINICQRRSLDAARLVLCVSRLWRDILARDYGIEAQQVANGVDTMRYTPVPSDHDNDVRRRLGISGRPVFLSVGGVEERKNTLRILQAFRMLLLTWPHAQLVIAGGASLLDHGAYQAKFAELVQASGIASGPGKNLLLTGQVADADMPALYRSANALVFPSLKEGFGLSVLEAMASGVPAIVSRIQPFTEYLGDAECLWANPLDDFSIAKAMSLALNPAVANILRCTGLEVCERFTWRQSALMHLDVYKALTYSSEELAHA
jgi:glycosyltransferase-like protein